MLLKLQGSTQGGVMFIINLLISYFVIYRSKNKSVAKLSKYLQRGWTSLATSNYNITVLRWQDNKLVHTISTYAGAIPEDKAKRFDRKSRTTIEITRPYAISEYNRFMGGVDIMDRMIAHYPHGFKNRKWYLRIFFSFF